MTALTAFSSGVIFEKFDNMTTLGTRFFKDRAGLPVAAVLAGALHVLPLVFCI
jgi:hypothetical protein